LDQIREFQNSLYTYLGLSLHFRRLPKSALQSMIQKIANMLPEWKRNLLTYIGRELLVKTVLTAMPSTSWQFTSYQIGLSVRLIVIDVAFCGEGRTQKRSMVDIAWWNGQFVLDPRNWLVSKLKIWKNLEEHFALDGSDLNGMTLTGLGNTCCSTMIALIVLCSSLLQLSQWAMEKILSFGRRDGSTESHRKN
jgi:hypothetical protein